MELIFGFLALQAPLPPNLRKTILDFFRFVSWSKSAIFFFWFYAPRTHPFCLIFGNFLPKYAVFFIQNNVIRERRRPLHLATFPPQGKLYKLYKLYTLYNYVKLSDGQAIPWKMGLYIRVCCHEAFFFQILSLRVFAAFLCTEIAQKNWKKSVNVLMTGNWF